jgi:peptidoglycan/xylan/chitin deacetylase (PgdA/CDA1 family)
MLMGTGGGSDTNLDSGKDTDSNIGTGTGTGTNVTRPTPTYTEDKNKYEPSLAPNGKISYLKYQIDYPELSKYYHNYQAAISMTFDDGDHTDTGRTLNELFAKYGFRGTLMFTANNVKNNIAEWQTILDKGYLDIGCHGYYHADPRYITDDATLMRETHEAVKFLRDNFEGQKVLTFATPMAFTTDEYEAELKKLVISNRLEAGGNKVVHGGNYNIYRIQAHSFNSGISSISINSKADEAVTKGEWLVELMHSVVDGSRYGTDINKDVFAEHCKYLYDKYNGKVWFGSFEEVSIYMIQYENTTIEYLDCDRDSMTFKMTNDLDKSIYNIPMSARFYIPSFANSAYCIIDGVEYDLEVGRIGSGAYMKKYVDVLDINPDGKPIKIVFGDNKNCSNGCVVHSYIEIDEIESTCTTHGYTIKECTLCGATYKLDYTPLHNYPSTKEKEIVTINGVMQTKYFNICEDCGHEKIHYYVIEEYK